MNLSVHDIADRALRRVVFASGLIQIADGQASLRIHPRDQAQPFYYAFRPYGVFRSGDLQLFQHSRSQATSTCNVHQVLQAHLCHVVRAIIGTHVDDIRRTHPPTAASKRTRKEHRSAVNAWPGICQL